MTIITIDPGESIGVIIYENGVAHGLTIKGDTRLRTLWEYLDLYNPDKIVYEEFALRQSAAQKLVGNKFITCEVIGVIKLWSQLTNKPLIPLVPMNKEFCGFSSNPKDPRYKEITMMPAERITEHVRDAYRLFNYARLFREEVLK